MSKSVLIFDSDVGRCQKIASLWTDSNYVVRRCDTAALACATFRANPWGYPFVVTDSPSFASWIRAIAPTVEILQIREMSLAETLNNMRLVADEALALAS
ncbi:MAG: hypothetical protein JSU00_26705 [Acidobacteria bacterium]|nr:hypothetical protein [Acidobacteriota bacterium]